MSSLVLGTVQFGLKYGINNSIGKPSLEQVQSIVDLAIENGIFSFDTAQGYGDAESVLGKALANKSSSLTVHSKFTLPEIWDFETIFSMAKISIQNLGIKKLGYFYFHRFVDFYNFSLRDINIDDSFYKFSSGLGVSVYDENELALALKSSHIRAVQLPINIFDCTSEKRVLLQQAKKQGIEVHCRSVFLQGLFFMDPEKLPHKLQPFKPFLIKLREVAETSSFSVMELALLYVKQIKEIDSVLVGVETTGQLLENVAAWNAEIPLKTLAALESLNFPNKELLLPKNWN